MVDSSALESIRDIFGGHSIDRVQNNFRTIYTRALESTTNHEANQTTPETTSVNLSSIDDILNNQLNVTIEERSETPPPSYNEASCLPTYYEACVLSTPNECLSIETHIVPNPLQTIENSETLYVNIPSRVFDEESSISAARPSITHPNIIPTSPNSYEHDNNIAQQINNSVIGAYHGMLQLLNINSIEETEQNSNPAEVSPSSLHVRSKENKKEEIVKKIIVFVFLFFFCYFLKKLSLLIDEEKQLQKAKGVSVNF